MNMSKSQAPRANAGSRANSKAQEHQIIASAVDWEADPATIWFARRFAYLEGVSQGEAARRLARMLGLEIGGRRHG